MKTQKKKNKNPTIIEMLTAINQRFSDIPALQIKEGEGFRRLTYLELGIKTAETSYNLMALGVGRGDRAAILSESRPEWAVAFFGIVSCGAVTVPMDIKLSDAEIEFILNHSEAVCLFISGKFAERITKLRHKLKHLKFIISFDELGQKDILFLKDFKAPRKETKHRDITTDDTAVIIYTSGTTGSAKGVVLTYGNLLFEVVSLHKLINLSARDRFLSILPLNHTLELTVGFFAPLYNGATVTYCDSLKPATLVSLMKETKTTIMICVPLVLKMFHNALMKRIEDMPPHKKTIAKAMLNLSRFLLRFRVRAGKFLFGQVHKQFGGALRCFVSGGAPLDPNVEMDFNALGFHVLQGYGLTETSPVVTVNNFVECKYGSVGKPLPGVEVKIMPGDLPAGREGEIAVRGPNVMRGYYKDAEKTAEVLRGGWFYTGDIGYFDEDGFLSISGRLKNMIVLGAGKKVFPEEVEEVLSKSRYIKEICVVGRVADKGLRKGTEEVYAVIVPDIDQFDNEQRNDKEFVRKTIEVEIDRLNKDLAEYKQVLRFELREAELPKTSTRKVKRREVL